MLWCQVAVRSAFEAKKDWGVDQWAQALQDAVHDSEVRITAAFAALSPVPLPTCSARGASAPDGVNSDVALWFTARGIAVREVITRLRHTMTEKQQAQQQLQQQHLQPQQ